MTIAATLGYPRIGPRREWKTALEAHWAGTLDEPGLRAAGAMLRGRARVTQRASGIGHVASADFALYDHVLETAIALGAIPGGDTPAEFAKHIDNEHKKWAKVVKASGAKVD